MLKRGSFVRRIGTGTLGIVTYVGLRAVEVLFRDARGPVEVSGVRIIGQGDVSWAEAELLRLRAGRPEYQRREA